MKILAVDQARHGAWAVYDYEGKKLLDYGAWGFDNKNYTFEQAILHIEALLSEVIRTHDIDAVFLEDIQLRKNVQSFNNIKTEIMIGLAGKAAVEVILQETDLGSYNDLENVYNHVHRILTETAVYNFNFMEFGPTIYEHLDSIIATEISRYYNKTRKILLENQAFVNELVDALINKGTLTHSEIMKLRKKHIT